MIKSPRNNVPDVGIELGAACMPRGHASDRATAPGALEKEDRIDEIKKKEQPTRPAPDASTAGPCPIIGQNSRTPRRWKLSSTITRPNHPLQCFLTELRQEVNSLGSSVVVHELEFATCFISILILSVPRQWFLTVTCSCCPYLYFVSPIM